MRPHTVWTGRTGTGADDRISRHTTIAMVIERPHTSPLARVLSVGCGTLICDGSAHHIPIQSRPYGRAA